MISSLRYLKEWWDTTSIFMFGEGSHLLQCFLFIILLSKLISKKEMNKKEKRKDNNPNAVYKEGKVESRIFK